MALMTIGEKIKFLRNQRGLKQAELGEILGVDDTTVSKWENNKNTPELDTLGKMCDLFNVTADYMLGRTETIAAHRSDDPMSDLSAEGWEFYKKVIEPLVEKELQKRLKGEK